MVPQGIERCRSAAEEGARGFLQSFEIEGLGPFSKDRLHASGQHRLQGAPQAQIIRGGHQVKRAPHRRHANDLAPVQRLEEVAATESFEAGPQPHEWRARHLCLHAREPLDGCQGRPVFPREQHLPGEQGAVELAGGEVGSS